MNIHPGQGVAVILPWFADGATGGYKRTLLVISIDTVLNQFSLLNVSTIKDKEHKLQLPSNEPLKTYKPPFNRPSFVKLDVVYTIDYFLDFNKAIFKSGALPPSELTRIVTLYNQYSQNHKVRKIHFNEQQMLNVNP